MEHSGQGAADHLTAEKAARFTTIMRLCASPAHGVTGSEEVSSEWDELGCLLSTGSHLADMAADQAKQRIAKALAASPDVDRDDIGDMTERVYRSISAWAVDDWESRSSCDGNDDEAPGDLNLEVLQVRPAVATGREDAPEGDDLSDLIDTTWHTGAGRIAPEDRGMYERAGLTVLCSEELHRHYDIMLDPHCLHLTLDGARRSTFEHSCVLKLADHVVFMEDPRRLKYLVAMNDDADKLVALGYATKE